MTLYDIYVMIRDNLGMGAFVVVVLFSLVEVSKIKINPWSWVGNLFNKELRSKIDSQGKLSMADYIAARKK